MGFDNTGIFGCGSATAAPDMSATGLIQMVSGVVGMVADTSGGSGPMNAGFAAIPDFPRHTLYQPKSIPAGAKMPVILWGM
jgi:hypothetical protein